MSRHPRLHAAPQRDVPPTRGSGYARAVAGGVELTLKIVPGASRSRVAGVLGDALKLQVAAPPEKGRASAAVVELLSCVLAVPTTNVSIIRGLTQPRKTARIRGATLRHVMDAIARATSM